MTANNAAAVTRRPASRPPPIGGCEPLRSLTAHTPEGVPAGEAFKVVEELYVVAAAGLPQDFREPRTAPRTFTGE